MDKKRFGQFIKESRLKQGYTQQELADLLYIDATAVSKWERGVSYPDITLIPDICKYLQVNEHELIASSDDTEYRKMKGEAKKYGRLKNGVFFAFGISYAVAVLTCFIVNLAVSGRLDWFFIVLAGCACGFTFCPTVMRFFPKNKLFAFISSTFASLSLLYVVCSVYASNYWFAVAMLGTLLGYVALFFPICCISAKRRSAGGFYQKFSPFFMLCYSACLLIINLLLEVVINAYHAINLSQALLITLYCYVLPLLWGVVELFKANRLLKLGVDTFITEGFCVGLYFVLRHFFGGENDYTDYTVNFRDWGSHTSGNVTFIIAVVFTVLGIALIACGIARALKNKND